MNKLMDLSFAGIAYAAIATVVAQALLVGRCWQQGMLTEEKVRDYAAIVYGYDVSEQRDSSRSEQEEADALQERVQQASNLALRDAAIASGALAIHGDAQELKRERERFEMIKASYVQLLAKLESEANARGVAEVRNTLEVIQPKQAKEMLLRILQTPTADARVDPVDSIIGIVRNLPPDRVKKIFTEFKSDEERQLLHRVLVKMGEFESDS